MASSNLTSDALLGMAEDRLLGPNDLTSTTVDRALDGVLGNGADFADLYFQTGHSESWHLADGKVASAGFSISEGVGVRSMSGDQTAFAHSSSMKPNAIAAATSAVRSMLMHGDNASPGGVEIDLPSTRPLLYPAADPAEALSSSEKINLLQELDRRCRGLDARIVRVSAALEASYTTILIAASDGTRAADVRPLVQLRVSVMAQDGLKRASGDAVGGGRFSLAGFDTKQLDRLVETATRIALVNLDARAAPSGAMSVVLGAGFPGVLLHEAVGHGLEADAHRKRSSVFVNHMNGKIACDSVTVVDDGTLHSQRGSLNVDDEGVPTRSNVLVENGRLTGLMQDRTSARMLGQQPTGNGRRQSYSRLPMPRMTNTFLAPGTFDRSEIIKSVKNGLLAVEFGGGQVDITSGQFNFSATEAYLIEDGRVTAPVKGATLIGMGHEALQHISMVGNDLDLANGVCGKEGQSVPVCVGQPTIRIDNMLVGGTA